MMLLKSRTSFIYSIFFMVTAFVSLPLFGQDKSDNSFSEGEMATIKKLALEALLENPEILREASKILQAKEELFVLVQICLQEQILLIQSLIPLLNMKQNLGEILEEYSLLECTTV